MKVSSYFESAILIASLICVASCDSGSISEGMQYPDYPFFRAAERESRHNQSDRFFTVKGMKGLIANRAEIDVAIVSPKSPVYKVFEIDKQNALLSLRQELKVKRGSVNYPLRVIDVTDASRARAYYFDSDRHGRVKFKGTCIRLFGYQHDESKSLESPKDTTCWIDIQLKNSIVEYILMEKEFLESGRQVEATVLTAVAEQLQCEACWRTKWLC